MREETTRVVHVHDKIPGAVYIGRATRFNKRSPLANPFVIGTHGDRTEVVTRYSFWLTVQITEGTPTVIDALIAARGKLLACWCRRDGVARTDANECHGDEIVEALNAYSDEDLLSMRRA